MAQETVKEINITILPKASLERQEAFKILLFNPTGGADIFRKVVFVEIVTSSGMIYIYIIYIYIYIGI